MKTYIFSLILLLMGSSLVAQQYPHRCAFDHAVHQRTQQYPDYQNHVNAVFNYAKRMAASQNHSRSTYTIPLIVHVVWNDSSEYLPECKVIEQVDIMNMAYQRLNPDTANLRPMFDTVVANPNIQFRLDSVIWRHTDSIFYSGGFLPDITFSDKVKHDSSGGSDAISPVDYLNIWFCSLGSSGVLGYAYPPAGLPNWPANSEAPTLGDEGVVVDYRVVGRQGAYNTGNNVINTRGHAAVHEVGHYLGLRHVWGDGLLSVLGIPDCNADDGLDDTPNAGIPSNYQCDSTQNTCNAGDPGDLPDMIENFMDYSEETCQNAFTADQVAVMQGVLNVERVGLSTTPPMDSTVRPVNDAQPFALGVPVNPAGSCTQTVSAITTDASPSMPACGGSTANDVWFSFEAAASGVIIDLSNIAATQGSGTTLVHELFAGSCGNLQSLGCSTNNSDTINGLQGFDTYFIRVYSNDVASAQSFDLCLQAYGIPANLNMSQLASEVHIFPNPTTGQLTVSVPTQYDFNGQVVIKNMLGQQVSNPLSIDQYANQIQLDLSTLANGIYLVEFTVGDQRFAKKVVLNK